MGTAISLSLSSAGKRLARVEQVVGVEAMGEAPSLSSQIGAIHGEMSQLSTLLRDLEGLLEVHATDANEKIKDAEDKGAKALQMIEQAKAQAMGQIEALQIDVNLLKQALGGATEVSERQRVKVLEPIPYDGTRDAKMVENFIWDMEHYFEAACVPTEEKMTIASMYLVGDAKLWWRTPQDVKEGVVEGATREAARVIDTWEMMKKELREQFLPQNVSWVAQDALRKLKHKESVRDYVMEFSSLMLGIHDMSEQDGLFNFMAGLQPWAQAELRRQGVRDLQSAVAAADALLDFQAVGTKEMAHAKKGKQRVRHQQEQVRDQGQPRHQASGPGPDRESKSKGSTSGCFICSGPHRASGCPRKLSEPKLGAVTSQQENGKEKPRKFYNASQLLDQLLDGRKICNVSQLIDKTEN